MRNEHAKDIHIINIVDLIKVVARQLHCSGSWVLAIHYRWFHFLKALKLGEREPRLHLRLFGNFWVSVHVKLVDPLVATRWLLPKFVPLERLQWLLEVHSLHLDVLVRFYLTDLAWAHCKDDISLEVEESALVGDPVKLEFDWVVESACIVVDYRSEYEGEGSIAAGMVVLKVYSRLLVLSVLIFILLPYIHILGNVDIRPAVR